MQQEMTYIYKIYQEGSFSKAAEKLFVTQSTLSMAVQRVECALGSKIFNRLKRPLELTPVGELYIQKYHEIYTLEKDLQEQINDLTDLNKGTLSLGGTQYIFSHILAPVLSLYAKRYPNISINLVECSSNQLVDKLLEGSIDIFLKCDEVHSPLKSLGHAFYDYLLLAMPESYRDQYNLPDCGFTREIVISGEYNSDKFAYLNPCYLDKMPLLSLTSGNNLYSRTLQYFSENQITPNIALKVSQMVTAYHLAINGLGYTLTTSAIIENSPDKQAIYYKLNSPLMIRDFHFITGTKSYLPKTAVKFIEMTKHFYS